MKRFSLGVGLRRTTIVGSMFCSATLLLTTTPLATASAQVGPTEVPESVGAPVGALPSAPLTLDALLEFADTHAPAVVLAAGGVDVARAETVAAEMHVPSNPELGLSAGGRTVDGTTALELEVSIAQTVELGGVRRARVDAADASIRAASAQVDAERWQVHVQVHSLFVDLLLAAEAREQAGRFVAFSERLRDVAARQVEAGESSPLVLLVTDADVAMVRERKVDADEQFAMIRARLAATIGWPEAELPSVVGVLPAVRPAPSVSDLMERVTGLHPTLEAMERQLEAHEFQMLAEERAGRIAPTFGATYAREGGPGVAPAGHIWTVDVGIPLPLWRRNQEGVARAAAALSMAERQRADIEVRLRTALEQGVIALNAAVERVTLYSDDVMPQLAANLALLERAYELGEIDVHQVSQTRSSLLDASAEYLRARVTYYESLAALEGLVGAEIWPHSEEGQ